MKYEVEKNETSVKYIIGEMKECQYWMQIYERREGQVIIYSVRLVLMSISFHEHTYVIHILLNSGHNVRTQQNLNLSNISK